MADTGVTGPFAPVATPARRFGYWTGHFVVVASMVGAGILSTSGYTLRDTGNPAALLALWALGGLMALAGAMTVAELATALPHAGGDYVFVREAFGRGAGFTAGWATFTLGFAAPSAVISHIALTYLTAPHNAALERLLPHSIAANVVPIGATFLIALLTLGHCLGQRESSRLQVIITAIKIALLTGFAVAGLTLGKGSWTHLAAGSWPTRSQWPALFVGLIYVCYAYSGWNGSAYLAGEIRDPARLLPRTLLFGTLTVTALYLLVNLVYVYALDPADMMAMPPDAVEKVADLAAERLFGRKAANVIATLFGLSLAASLSAYILTGPRVAFAMARDGVFPGFAGRLHTARGIPIHATLLQGGIAIALVWSGSFLQLLDYTSVGLAAVSGLVVASVFPIRRRRDLPHPFRMPLYPAAPLLYLGLVGWTIANQLMQPDRRIPSLLSLATLLFAVPVGWWLGRNARGKAAGESAAGH